MLDFLNEIGTELIAAVVAAGLTLFVSRQVKVRRQRRIRERFADLLGLDTGPLVVVHSAVLDPSRGAYNYPASDSRSARILAIALDSVGLREGTDYFIFAAPEVDSGLKHGSIWEHNVMLLCGPKRNPFVTEALAWASGMHYRMGVSLDSGENYILDSLRNSHLSPTARDADGKLPTNAHDYAYLLSFPSPRAVGKRITIVAGIHGVGTLGGVQFMFGDTEGRPNTEVLFSRARNGAVSEAVRVDYAQNEAVTGTILV